MVLLTGNLCYKSQVISKWTSGEVRFDRGSGTAPRFTSSSKGLGLYAELLDELGVPATFFAEGQTLERLIDQSGDLDSFEIAAHGYEHEDFSTLDKEEIEARVVAVKNAIKDYSGTYPKSFRAPYMSVSDELLEVLSKNGFVADSSTYSDYPGCKAYSKDGHLVEVPVLRESCGRSAYLWPMHEGKRDTQSYVEMARRMPEDHVLVMADHSWHLVESRSRGVKSCVEIQGTVSDIVQMVGAVLDMGYVPMTICGVAKRISF